MRLGRLFIVGLILLLVVGLSVWRMQSMSKYSSENKLRVVASFYPVAFFASGVGGDLAKIENITPAGVEPHDFELPPATLGAIEQADQVFLMGGIENWTNKATEIAPERVTLLSSGINTRANDFHVWLDPLLAMRIVTAITSSYEKMDAAHSVTYRANADKLLKGLEKLDSEYRANLKNCSTRTFVTSHSAFGYLADRYALTQVNLAGFSPESEPNAKDLVNAIKQIKDRKIEYVFTEALISPKVAETVARETNTKVLQLNPIEGLTPDQEKSGVDYFSLQYENLLNLKKALGCKG